MSRTSGADQERKAFAPRAIHRERAFSRRSKKFTRNRHNSSQFKSPCDESTSWQDFVLPHDGAFSGPLPLPPAVFRISISKSPNKPGDAP
jgi:hypothetical protein